MVVIGAWGGETVAVLLLLGRPVKRPGILRIGFRRPPARRRPFPPLPYQSDGPRGSAFANRPSRLRVFALGLEASLPIAEARKGGNAEMWTYRMLSYSRPFASLRG